MDSTSVLLQMIISGLYISSKYVLLAMSLSLIFGVMDIADFAQGALFMVGALLIYFFVTFLGISYFIALPISIFSIALIAILNDTIVYKRLRGFEINSLIAALGIMLILENVATAIVGSKYLTVKSPFGTYKFVFFQNVIIAAQEVFAILVCAFVVGLIWMFLKKTKSGRALRAMSQNRDAAALMGININKISLLTFGLSGSLAGIAGALVAPTQVIVSTMGAMIILKAFVITVLGGMGSVFGAVAAALIIGYAEIFTVTYFTPAYSSLVAFVILITVLLFKPEGIWGK
jgi:branched-chain amino acid transport system permease protein